MEGQAVTVDLSLSDASSFGDYFDSIEGVMATNFDDVILGNGDANLISAEEGDDRLYGAGGADILSGGLGSDNYEYNAVTDSVATSWDTINDFETGSDILSLNFTVDIADVLIQTATGQSLVTVTGTDFAVLVNDTINYSDIIIA